MYIKSSKKRFILDRFARNMANFLYFKATFGILSLFIASSLQLNLTIIHTNDVHARFEQFDKYSVSCDDEDAQDGKCFGGVARRATMIKQIRAEEDHVLLLDGGDQFQGTNWFYVHRGKAAAHFTNKLGYDVMVSQARGVKAYIIPAYSPILVIIRYFLKVLTISSSIFYLKMRLKKYLKKEINSSITCIADSCRTKY